MDSYGFICNKIYKSSNFSYSLKNCFVGKVLKWFLFIGDLLVIFLQSHKMDCADTKNHSTKLTPLAHQCSMS